ncbi:hypothetical protein WH47_11193 [Habropoda laboriosa]|uniref:Uncharacterized protein n=1 Tax=Habropoda laboriosa TaxID=597456 RepID=A0A0L7RA81_9HYME|nr:hypothetical protein WH47_11193 [Habropoda laboriosa]
MLVEWLMKTVRQSGQVQPTKRRRGGQRWRSGGLKGRSALEQVLKKPVPEGQGGRGWQAREKKPEEQRKDEEELPAKWIVEKNASVKVLRMYEGGLKSSRPKWEELLLAGEVGVFTATEKRRIEARNDPVPGDKGHHRKDLE